jgi:succinate-semialdehyde dehydrogenase/glutarate-semialdehyde dehydrogenase/succinyl-CoA reductase
MNSINPATGEVLASFEASTEKEVEHAVQKARKAVPVWSSLSIDERCSYVREFLKKLRSSKKEFAELITKEMGKAIKESEDEIEGAVADMEWFLSATRDAVEPENTGLKQKGMAGHIFFEPVGVVGVITPWNFPLGTPIWKVIPALLTGNTLVFKPSELSTLCSDKIHALFEAAGLPKNVMNMARGGGSIGKILVESSVDMISFTGSSAAGKDVYSRASAGMKKVVLELGGSDPFIAFGDAPLNSVVKTAVFGRFFNCGQVCTAAKRILVQREIFEDFVDGFVKEAGKLKVGDPLDRKTDVGPLVSGKQLETLEGQVKDAISKGVKLLLGGKRLPGKGFFYEPTVLSQVKPGMRVFEEEVFGPVASIMPFNGKEDAIRIANSNQYGLGASVWTRNMELAEEVASRLEAGMVWINDFGTPYPQCPQGGMKASGFGREMSIYGIREFCRMKTVVRSP